VVTIGLISLTLFTQTHAVPPHPHANLPKPDHHHSPQTRDTTYKIPSKIQKGTATARFKIASPNKTLSNASILSLDVPQISKVTSTSFDWWYFDAVSTENPAESLTVILFTSAASAFPWLDPSESSVLIAYLWATFANGSVFQEYVPAKLAVIDEGQTGKFLQQGSGTWDGSGFRWVSGNEDSVYKVVVKSEEMGVHGTFTLNSQQSPHLPCGIQDGTSTLEIVPNIGWASLVPDAVGSVDMVIQGSTLNFKGRGYHDKNWSNLPFTESVQSWYWGHGRIGIYSILWFSAIAMDNNTHTSSYVARDDQVLVSSCDTTLLTVRPLSANVTSNPTGGRYPPQAGDTPDGFIVEAYLGDEKGWLNVNASIVTLVTGDGEYYMRWSGELVGRVVDSQGVVTDAGSGVAVFEQFALVE
ncbi:Hydroxyneurosporene synthase, partial [Penicillium longicatenatum]|uniref:Hydroxyneurosporene synthase n=1 Tax=Penicillium longicatenatum TaxID=1561947 RepID=UPI0025475767